MASEWAQKQQYEYKNNSNLVLQADRRLIESRCKDEPTGEVQSIIGDISKYRMGDKFERSKAPISNKSNKSDKKQKVDLNLQEISGIMYKPKIAETRSVYESILSFIQSIIGEQPRDILMGACDEVLSVVKDESIREKEKHSEICGLLGSLKDEKYSILINLCKKITDYHADQDLGEQEEGIGVTVQYDDDEDDDAKSNENDNGIKIDEESLSDKESNEEFEKCIHGKFDDHELNKNDTCLLNPWEIDAFWLQRELNKFYEDAELSHKKAKEIIEILKLSTDDRDLENKLVLLLGHDKFSLIKKVRINKNVILYCTLLAAAQSDEDRENIQKIMLQNEELSIILEQYKNEKNENKVDKIKNIMNKNLESDVKDEKWLKVDLDYISFKEGGKLMTNKKCHLPEGSYRKQRRGYEEVHVPFPKPTPLEEGEELFPTSKLPDFVKTAFSKYQHLNRIQSRIVQKALYTDENLLICAPTGSGKTNIAILCILREMGKYLNEENKVNLEEFKIVYIAPMKSLVQEIVMNFSSRLAEYSITVSEMTGDHQLNRDQIDKTQIIVCTPEKWDIVTRKAGERTFTQLVRLIIIDEIHMLHDDRGPVLESLVARTLRYTENSQQQVRIVGLSATLPNYRDVSIFIGANPDSGLFYFDNTYRPVPLEQEFIGLTEKKPLKCLKIMNEIVYDKLIHKSGAGQVLVFVHSRKETVKTAKWIRDTCIEKETLGIFVRAESASGEILKSEADQTKNADLKELLPYGFGIHHAGMNRIDRKLVEDLFADGHINVLFTTATLAWGVNLPAHTVIIKGTQIYNPEKGKWVHLGSLDVLQMLGRAGRPQYDTSGLGILITSHSELQFYLSLTNQQLPIESQLISKISDHLNAEISLGTVSSVEEGANWLSYTYYYIRMLKNPSLYGVSNEELENDPRLLERRLSIIHTAAMALDKCSLINYDQRSGSLIGTELGRIASHYYCTMESITTYNKLLRPSMSQIELFRVISFSSEFKYVTIRAEEKLELQHLIEKVPIPLKETIEEPAAKINILLQAYISQLKLEGFVLMADMVYITQSAGRLIRTIFEICHSRNWASVTENALNLSKMIDKRMWMSMSPLRQFTKIPIEIVKKLEKKDISWDRFYDLEAHEIGELIHAPKMGKVLHKFIHHFPKLEISTHIQPITRSLLKIELTIIPDFIWDDTIHGNCEAFWIFVTDIDGESILHSEYFILNYRYCTDEHYLKFYVSLFDPLSPCYYIKVISDRWLHSQTILPISLINLLLPEKNPPPTELLDLQLLPLSNIEILQQTYPYINTFNSIQTQSYNSLVNTNDNILICAPNGSGKSLCAEVVILSYINDGKMNNNMKVIYMVPYQNICEIILERWKGIFKNLTVGMLTGESTADIKIMNTSNIIISNPENFDMFSRRWKQRKVIQLIKLFIVDDLHMIGGINGPCIEIVCSRIRYISSQLSTPIRIIALSYSLLNARDIGQWLGVHPNNIFNFHPTNRPLPLSLHIQGFSLNNPISRVLAMNSTIYSSYKTLQSHQNLIIYVASTKQAKLVALELSMLINNEVDSNGCKILSNSEKYSEYYNILTEKELQQSLNNGNIGYIHESMSILERNLLEKLFEMGEIKVLVISYELCWCIKIMSSMIIIMDTQYYDGSRKNYIDYSTSDLLKMIGRCGNPLKDNVGIVKILCLTSKKDQLIKFLKDPLPIESHLDHCLHDHFNAEIVTHVIQTKQDAVDYLTWTFLYRRMSQNSNYYNMTGISHRHLSDHLSELVENTLNDLQNSKCITIDDLNVSPLNSGMIAAYYYIRYHTIELFNSSLNAKTKLKGMIEIISSSAEFDILPLRINDESHLKNLLPKLIYKIKDGKTNEIYNKVNILIQCYLSRIPLSNELQLDSDFIIRKTHKLIQAAVDVISSNGWLQPAIVAMEFAQMITQATWSKESPLKQIPYFTHDLIEKCQKNNINNVFDLLDMEDVSRQELLQLSPIELAQVAKFCNGYPSLEVKYQISNDGFVIIDENVTVTIEIERDEIASYVIAPYFPYNREEAIWVIVGQVDTNLLLAIKRINIVKSSSFQLEFIAPNIPGSHNYTLYLLSDSYLGSDQEFPLQLHVNESRKRKLDTTTDINDSIQVPPTKIQAQ